MTLFQALTCISLAVAIIFLLAGLALELFGNRRNRTSSSSAKIELSLAGKGTVSVPYQTSYVLCGIGLALLLISLDFYKNAPTRVGNFSLMANAHAKELKGVNVGDKGWLYFGYEKDPAEWNFKFVEGTYASLIADPKKTVLKSVSAVNLRQKPFGDFTGTVFGFLDPPAPILGQLEQDTCVAPSQVKSVGFDKIWIQATIVNCPP